MGRRYQCSRLVLRSAHLAWLRFFRTRRDLRRPCRLGRCRVLLRRRRASGLRGDGGCLRELWGEGLDASVEHFGESGEVGDVFDADAGVAKEFGGASGGDEFDADSRELAGEVDESSFIRDRENGALNFE